MSTPDSSYIARLAAAARKLAGVHCVGETWISFDGAIPTGGVPFTGQLVSRTLYADLWAWVQANKTVVTESAWQATATAQNGMCASYSSGDGSTTFRVPNVVGGYFCGGDTSTAGGYTQAGLPNITGTQDYGGLNDIGISNSGGTGCFTTTSKTLSLAQLGDTRTTYQQAFDASRSNPIYGNSDTVTPETFRVLVGVYAIGSAGNIGSPEAQAALSAIATLESNRADTSLGNLTAAGKNVAAGASMPSGRSIDLTVGAGGSQYTAPCTGWFAVYATTTNTHGYVYIYNITCGISMGEQPEPANFACRAYVPVTKGDTVRFDYDNITIQRAVFIYAEGAE